MARVALGGRTREGPCVEHTVTGGTTARTEAVHLHDFVEDGEFKCELDGVCQRLRGFFV